MEIMKLTTVKILKVIVFRCF